MKHKKLQRKSQDDDGSSNKGDTSHDHDSDDDMDAHHLDDADDVISDDGHPHRPHTTHAQNKDIVTCADEEEIDVVSDTDADTGGSHPV